MLYYFKKGKNATEPHKQKKPNQNTKVCAVYGEGAETDRTGQRGWQSSVLEISRWTMPHSRVDQLEVDSDQIETFIKNIQHYAVPHGR